MYLACCDQFDVFWRKLFLNLRKNLFLMSLCILIIMIWGIMCFWSFDLAIHTLYKLIISSLLQINWHLKKSYINWSFLKNELEKCLIYIIGITLNLKYIILKFDFSWSSIGIKFSRKLWFGSIGIKIISI